ncbi:MAG: hypothetical protein FWG02_02975 [Holophagaceae bacterium]|nr:hypothetical protein [Holophagaceae bacterium]
MGDHGRLLSRLPVVLIFIMSSVISIPYAFGQGAPPPQRPPQQRPPTRPPSQPQRPPTPRTGPQRQPAPSQRTPIGEEGRYSGRPTNSAKQDESLERAERTERRGGGGYERPDRDMERRERPPARPERPSALPRLAVYPRFVNIYWNMRFRSILNDIRFVSRRGYIPVTAIPADVYELTDYSETPAGWRGYGMVVPPGETVTINLEHPNRGWFRLIICDAWGQAVPGGLSSRLPQMEPRLTYTNVGNAEKAIYLLVDDPGWMSSGGSPYLLQFARSWNPSIVSVNQELIVAGIWGLESNINARFRRPMLVMPGF